MCESPLLALLQPKKGKAPARALKVLFLITALLALLLLDRSGAEGSAPLSSPPSDGYPRGD